MSCMCLLELEWASLKPSPLAASYFDFYIAVTNKIKLQNIKPLSCKHFSKDLTICHVNGHIDLNGVH